MAKIEFQKPHKYTKLNEIFEVFYCTVHTDKINIRYKEKEKKYSDHRNSKSFLGKITQYQRQNKTRKTTMYTLVTYKKVYCHWFGNISFVSI